jgi:hypothetical protein
LRQSPALFGSFVRSDPRRANTRRNDTLAVVAFCRVTYRDIEGVEHSVEIEAESLYEAVAKAVNRFRRDDCWGMHPPGPGCQFQVKALKDAPVTYNISLAKVRTSLSTVQHAVLKMSCERIGFGSCSEIRRAGEFLCDIAGSEET